MTTATLGFEIRSDQAATAKANLDKMTTAAEQAEAAQKRLAASSAGSNAGLAKIASGVEQANVMLAKLVAITEANIAASTKLGTAKQSVAKAAVDGARASDMATAALRQEAVATDQVTAAIRRQNEAEAAHIAKARARSVAGVDAWGRTTNEVQAHVAANSNRGQPIAIAPVAQAQVAQAEAVTKAASAGAMSVRTLAAGLTAAIMPVSILQFGIFALASAATEWATSMLSGTDKTEKALERHKKWVDEIAAAYPKAAAAAKAYEEEAKKLPNSALKADTLEKEKADKARLKSLMGDLAVTLEASNLLGAVSSPADRAAFSQLAELIKEGKANAADIQKALGDIRLDPNTTDDARDFAASLQKSALDAAELEAKLKGVKAAMQEISGQRGPLIGSIAEKERNDYLDDVRLSLRSGQKSFDAAVMGIGARSPQERAAAARARETASLGGGMPSEVANQRVELAGQLALLNAQHMIDEAQKERARSLDQLMAGQQLDITLIGKTAGEAAKLRMEFDLISQVREEAARNGIAADEAEIASIREKVAELGKLVDVQARLNLNRDLDFERSQLFLSRGEQAIASRLRDTGLGMDSPEAGQMREMQRISDLRDGVRGFFDDFESGLMRGDDFGKALGNAVLNALMRALDTVLDNALTSITNSIVTSVFGASAGSGKGGSGAGILGDVVSSVVGKKSASNDNYAPGAVTRSPLPDIGSGSSYSVANATSFIQQYASAIGIDPSTALRVAKSEGLGAGIWQSNALKNGIREPSYGPLQLLKGGAGTGYPTGLGNSFQRSTGLDPANQANWQQATAFGLDHAKTNGWGAWYGAKAQGITGFDGIDRSASKAVGALDRLTTGSTKAVGGIGHLGQAGDQATKGLSSFASNLSKFPAAPGGGGGGAGGLLGGLLSGGLSSAFSGTAAFNWLSANPGGYIGLYADGGRVSGPGSGTSDSVPAMLSNGEYVVKASAASKYLPFLEAINDNRIQHRATGGPIGRVGSSAPMSLGGGNKVNININNLAGAQVSAEATEQPDGSTSIDVLVDRVVADKLSTRGSASNNTMRQQFGAQSALKRR